MFSQAISLRRLKFYEAQCRNGRASAGDELTKQELTLFEASFRAAAMDNAAMLAESDPSEVWNVAAE
jgi:hypothetical protein